jgi:hypothetical protein
MQGREGAQRPPHAVCVLAVPARDLGLHLGAGAGPLQERRELGEQRVGVVGGQPCRGEPAVVEA